MFPPRVTESLVGNFYNGVFMEKYAEMVAKTARIEGIFAIIVSKNFTLCGFLHSP